MVLKATYLWEFENLQLEEGTLADGTSVTWMQAFPLGTYSHPTYGKIDSNPDFVGRMASNIKEGARGTELDIDYDHKQYGGKAAGWVKDAQARPDGLWIAVEWTPDAKASIQKKEYRYFSPEFVGSWTHPKTGVKYKDVLFGGAITNRPFLKDIQPINMSELLTEQLKEGSVDPKELRAIFGLSEDATDEQLTEAATAAAKAAKAEPEVPKIEDKKEEPAPATKEVDPVLATLAETNPAVRVLMDKLEAAEVSQADTNRRLAEIEASARLSEVSLKLSEVNAAAKGNMKFSEAQILLAKDALAIAPIKCADAMFKLLANIAEKGLVQFGELGSNKNEHTGDLGKQFSDKVEALLTADPKLGYADAATKVASEEPELFNAYMTSDLGGV